jgi:hypothetical protein
MAAPQLANGMIETCDLVDTSAAPGPVAAHDRSASPFLGAAHDTRAVLELSR